ncbi:MAG: DUF7269 family protein [Halolamina sp.]
MRRALAAVGAVSVLVGLFVSFQQEFAGAIPATWAFVLLLAIVAGVQAITTTLARRRTAIQEAETGDPERRYEAPTPGDELRETLRYARNRSRGRHRPRHRIRERVAEAAIGVLTDVEGCSEDEAREQIRTGEWTDDPIAAWFLGEEIRLSPRQRARLFAAAPFSQFAAAFSRTVDEIDATRSGER